VPVEFIGLARSLRNRVVAARGAGAADRLLAPFRPRPRFTPVPTKRRLYALCEAWRDLPELGRLSAIATLDRAGCCRVAELRLTPARLSFPGWDGDEPALALRSVAAALAPPAFALSETLVAGVGLHALARRFERGEGRDEASVLRDLAPLATAHRVVCEVGGEFRVAAPGGGRWVGTVTSVGGERVLVVRTFVAA
jgi:hypothetical protein